MITPRQPTDKTQSDWRHHLAQSITDPVELLRLLKLPTDFSAPACQVETPFPFRVTRHYASLMEPNNPDDPLLRQVLPSADEFTEVTGYQLDPVGDAEASLGNGLLQKYQGRALLVTTGACAIHCRYCFRRHYPYAENHALRDWRPWLEKLRQRTDIKEMILSGGDPLSLSDQRLGELIAQLGDIPHLQRLRLHSRLPIVLPERISAELVNTLSETRLDTSLVLHCNHPHELSPSLRPGLHALRSAGITLLNQSVLLANVNDDADILKHLSERLFTYGVLPYYLHLLDPVQGAAHFAVTDQKIAEIQAALSAGLPGYLVPRMVREIPGAAAKTPWLESLR